CPGLPVSVNKTPGTPDIASVRDASSLFPSRSIEEMDPGTFLLICVPRSEEHTSELQSRENLVCRLLLEKKKRRILLRRPPPLRLASPSPRPRPWPGALHRRWVRRREVGRASLKLRDERLAVVWTLAGRR